MAAKCIKGIVYSALTAEELEKIKACCENAQAGGGLTLELVGDEAQLKNSDGAVISTIDLSKYIDDTNLARTVSGVVDANGIMTLTRDDGTTFEIDMSAVFSSLGDKDVASSQFVQNGDELTLEITLNDGTVITSNKIVDTHVTDITLED